MSALHHSGNTVRYDTEPPRMILSSWPVVDFVPHAPPIILSNQAEVAAYNQKVRAREVAAKADAFQRLNLIKPALNALEAYHRGVPYEIRFNPSAGILVPNQIVLDLVEARLQAYTVWDVL